MLIQVKCLHNAVAKEYKQICKEDSTFHSFLIDVLPLLDVTQCSRCDLSNKLCDGENFEYLPDPDSFILYLERVRQGLEDIELPNNSYSSKVSELLRYFYSDCDAAKSFDLRNALPIDPQLLSGSNHIDKILVNQVLARRNRSPDHYLNESE